MLLLARLGARGRVVRFLGGVFYPLYLNHWIALVAVSSLAALSYLLVTAGVVFGGDAARQSARLHALRTSVTCSVSRLS